MNRKINKHLIVEVVAIAIMVLIYVFCDHTSGSYMGHSYVKTGWWGFLVTIVAMDIFACSVFRKNEGNTAMRIAYGLTVAFSVFVWFYGRWGVAEMWFSSTGNKFIIIGFSLAIVSLLLYTLYKVNRFIINL